MGAKASASLSLAQDLEYGTLRANALSTSSTSLSPPNIELGNGLRVNDIAVRMLTSDASIGCRMVF